MNRRSFLQACIAAASAPAFVRAEVLMPIVDRSRVRGVSYIVFDELDLQPFGYRIPTFTIEGVVEGSESFRQVAVNYCGEIIKRYTRVLVGEVDEMVYDYIARRATVGPVRGRIDRVLADGREIAAPYRIEPGYVSDVVDLRRK